MLEALSLLRDREFLRTAKRNWLEAEIQKGTESADHGELLPAEDVFDRLEAKYGAMVEKQGKA